MKSINVVGIHYGHNATVSLLRNGEIMFCLSEERLNRIKNSTGIPFLALEYVKKNFGEEIDYYVMTQRFSWGFKYLKKRGFKSGAYNLYYADTKRTAPWPAKLIPDLWHKYLLYKLPETNHQEEKNEGGRREVKNYFSNLLSAPREKILFFDHHLTHAFSTKFFLERPKKQILIFTLDGEGDGLCATVNILENQQLSVLSKVDRVFSLGYLYKEITAFLGMKPDEHEFKVMGLAPYAKEKYVDKLMPFFRGLLWLNDRDEFESSIPMTVVKYHLKEKLIYHRFDNIAGAIQKFTEEIVLDWVKRWIKKTGLTDIAVAGGVFMNVKLNQKISELPEVSGLTVAPSAGDESTVLGACYYGYEKYCRENNSPITIKPIKNLYLGTEYTEEEIEDYLKTNNYFAKYHIERPDNLSKKIAELLSQNQVVARFAGRMEFGARALGNRSILANPAGNENVRIINEMIKNRDFWMPFAATILAEDADRYLINPKKINAPFMAITFNTTPAAQKDLPTALHPSDKTSRSQILKREDNPDYYEIISEFKKLTGIGGVLNTSFNLHGEPNVESPKDALRTFDNSGLNYLAIGPFLISKPR